MQWTTYDRLGRSELLLEAEDATCVKRTLGPCENTGSASYSDFITSNDFYEVYVLKGSVTVITYWSDVSYEHILGVGERMKVRPGVTYSLKVEVPAEVLEFTWRDYDK